jgi:hypothetical protein
MLRGPCRAYPEARPPRGSDGLSCFDRAQTKRPPEGVIERYGGAICARPFRLTKRMFPRGAYGTSPAKCAAGGDETLGGLTGSRTCRSDRTPGGACCLTRVVSTTFCFDPFSSSAPRGSRWSIATVRGSLCASRRSAARAAGTSPPPFHPKQDVAGLPLRRPSH